MRSRAGGFSVSRHTTKGIALTASTTGLARHSVTVEVADARDSGCLLKLVSIFHARAIPVIDMSYARDPAGSATLSVGFHASVTQASTLEQTLLRSVHVTGVDVRPVGSPEMSSAVGL
jgi:hypothetical protein